MTKKKQQNKKSAQAIFGLCRFFLEHRFNESSHFFRSLMATTVLHGVVEYWQGLAWMPPVSHCPLAPSTKSLWAREFAPGCPLLVGFGTAGQREELLCRPKMTALFFAALSGFLLFVLILFPPHPSNQPTRGQQQASTHKPRRFAFFSPAFFF